MRIGAVVERSPPFLSGWSCATVERVCPVQGRLRSAAKYACFARGMQLHGKRIAALLFRIVIVERSCHRRVHRLRLLVSALCPASSTSMNDAGRHNDAAPVHQDVAATVLNERMMVARPRLVEPVVAPHRAAAEHHERVAIGVKAAAGSVRFSGPACSARHARPFHCQSGSAGRAELSMICPLNSSTPPERGATMTCPARASGAGVRAVCAAAFPENAERNAATNCSARDGCYMPHSARGTAAGQSAGDRRPRRRWLVAAHPADLYTDRSLLARTS